VRPERSPASAGEAVKARARSETAAIVFLMAILSSGSG
jgi:hypothetical protein